MYVDLSSQFYFLIYEFNKNKLFKQPAGFHREVITDVTKWKHPEQKNEINFQKVQFLLGPPEPGFKTESNPQTCMLKCTTLKQR